MNNISELGNEFVTDSKGDDSSHLHGIMTLRIVTTVLPAILLWSSKVIFYSTNPGKSPVHRQQLALWANYAIPPHFFCHLRSHFAGSACYAMDKPAGDNRRGGPGDITKSPFCCTLLLVFPLGRALMRI